MSVQPGLLLGPYEIVREIGRGGMGEVYLANDTRLDRQVAIKALPDSMARDKERVLRFEREAKLLASLNHPNIAAIHGFEETDGKKFLVLEYVEGETLADRLKHGALPVDDALDVARQIAEGVEAAHEKGVIHRDLKPGNVMVKPDGTVKVLDFGLARAMVEEPSGPALADSPTITANYTKPGVVLGTAAYMSPEQARGRAIDKRTDLWSLGCVLFECLTAKRTFDGTTAADTVARIVSERPDVDLLPVNTPAFAVRLLRRCLEKDPRRRLRDVGELRFAIQEFQANPESELVGEPSASTRRAKHFGRRTPWVVVTVLVTLLAIALSVRERPTGSLSRPVSRWSITLPDKTRVGITGTGGWFDYSRQIAVSPDGSRVVYAVQRVSDQSRLYIRELGDLEARPIPGTANGRGPFFSPDGEWLGFASKNGLQKVRLSGGSPQRICEVSSVGFDASWAPDGKTIVFSTDAGLWHVPGNGGTPEQLTQPRGEDEEVGHHAPYVTIDGGSVLFTLVTTTGSNLALLSLETQTWSTIVRNATQGVPLHTGQLLFARRGELLVAPYGPSGIAGPPVSVLQNVHTLPGLAGVVVTQFDVSRTGTLVYVPAAAETVDQLLWVDHSGNETLITSGPGTWVHPRLSPDGTRISVDIHSRDGMRDVYIYEQQRGQLNRLTHEGVTWESEWRPDGERIAMMSAHPPGYWSLFWANTNFSEPAELLLVSRHAIPTGWSPDGRTLLYFDYANGGIWKISPETDGRPESVIGPSPNNERWGRLSPNGEWIAYVADESGRRQVYVQSYPGLGPKHKVSIDGGGEPVWSRDGRKLFFREGDQMYMAEIEYQPTFTCSKPEPLFSGNYDAAPIGHQHYDVSLDGERFLMIKHGNPTGPKEVRVVMNWFDDLEAAGQRKAGR